MRPDDNQLDGNILEPATMLGIIWNDQNNVLTQVGNFIWNHVGNVIGNLTYNHVENPVGNVTWNHRNNV